MSIKVHYLRSHLDQFSMNVGSYSEERKERLHQDLKTIEERYIPKKYREELNPLDYSKETIEDIEVNWGTTPDEDNDFAIETLESVINKTLDVTIPQIISLAPLQTAFDDEAPWKTTIYNWFAEFKRGRVNLSAEFGDDRPSTAVNNKTTMRCAV
ncbi:hypothetical protein EVAR_30778_1 [Eumeta japonica]|uniref:Uncharacterized protein n=1 Tax=Eumeta variegata TaxID=151549 RepID=A0A4C1V884_EUMVA|nr:hypothetical protein EVAR_30778_1 [Eumeta japonica]